MPLPVLLRSQMPLSTPATGKRPRPPTETTCISSIRSNPTDCILLQTAVVSGPRGHFVEKPWMWGERAVREETEDHPHPASTTTIPLGCGCSFHAAKYPDKNKTKTEENRHIFCLCSKLLFRGYPGNQKIVHRVPDHHQITLKIPFNRWGSHGSIGSQSQDNCLK